MDATPPSVPPVPDREPAGSPPTDARPAPQPLSAGQLSAAIGAAEPLAAGPGPVVEKDWAVCCSGGGIRSATYCLGALQSLDRGGLLGKARWILGVSGGSYIAASRALVAGDLQRHPVPGAPSAYARATAEERSLRDNTHYIAPDAKTVLVGILSLLLGAAVTFILAMAPVYAVSHAWGWLLRWQGVLTWSHGRASASLTAWTWWLAPAAAAAISVALFGYWWATLPTGSAGRGTRRARLVGWACAITAGLALVMLAAPPLISWLYNSTGAVGTIARFFGFGGTGRWSPATLAGLVAALAAIARFCRSQLSKVTALPGASGARAGTPGKLVSWFAGQLTPWLASAAIIAIAAAAALLWTGAAAHAGYGPAQLTAAVVALLVMFLTRACADVNRMSMHDFYRWRLADAYAVTRRAVTEPDPLRRRDLLAHAARTRLSDLRAGGSTGDRPAAAGVRPEPELVIGATANINARREVPPGRGGFSFTFDPVSVTLRGAPGGEEHDISADTADYEHLVGHTRLTLFDVVAISGAAFSPLMGAMTRGAYRILLTATNMRLGVWLPHPRVVSEARAYLDQPADLRPKDRWWVRRTVLLLLWYVLPHPRAYRNAARTAAREARLWAHVLELREGATRRRRAARLRAAVCWRLMQPTLGMLWAEAVGHTSYRATWINVTDGGHYDNLGLVEALRRGARNIVVLDASGDHPRTWFTLGGAMALARVDAGVEIDLEPTSMVCANGTGPAVKLADGEVLRPWARGTFTLRDTSADGRGKPVSGNIWVCKLGWWEQAPWDIRAYAAGHPSYPCETTLQQLYDGAEFEAYQELGACAVVAAAQGALPLVLPASGAASPPAAGSPAAPASPAASASPPAAVSPAAAGSPPAAVSPPAAAPPPAAVSPQPRATGHGTH